MTNTTTQLVSNNKNQLFLNSQQKVQYFELQQQYKRLKHEVVFRKKVLTIISTQGKCKLTKQIRV